LGEVPVLELRTFGGLRLIHRGREHEPLPDRLALLLARLIAARGRTVRATELVDLIWPDDPPGSAQNQLHRYIGDLRRVLEPGIAVRDVGRIVVRHNEGYRLILAGIRLDLDEFEALLSRARDSQASKRDDEAVELLVQALGIAAQPAFTDLARLPCGRAQFEVIEEDRVAAAVLLADCALEAMTPDRAVPTVSRIAAQAPLHEVLQAKYIRLLTAAGRTAEGLAHYEATGRTLREAFGVDPGPALRAAHLATLSPVGADASPSRADRASNLPPANPSYVDPPAGEERFARLLAEGVGLGTITVLCGGGGLGKTTLAVHLARLLEQRSAASSIFLDLRGFDPERDPLTPDAAVEVALTQLGVEHADLGPDERERALRFAVEAGPLIAVLDSARDAEQVRPLLVCLSGATVIITTRPLLQTLVVREGARLVQLDRWDERTALVLLAERLGVRGSAAGQPALAAIARACDGLPLALSIAAARCAGVEPSRWDAFARELNDGAGPLDALAIVAGSDDVRSVFATSLRVLDDSALTVFRRGALVPEASADVHALAAVSGFDLDSTRRAIRVLLGSSLLRDAGDGSFGMHDLVRSFALELLVPEERAAAESRALSYVALTARHVWSLTGRPPVGSGSAPRVDEWIVPRLADLGQARAWSARNLGWVDELSRVGVRLGLHRDVVTTRLDLRPAIDRLLSASTWLELLSELDHLASGLDDPALLAEVRNSSGSFSSLLFQPEEAARQYGSAIEIFKSLGDHGGVAKTYRNMAMGASLLGDFDGADRWLTQAVEAASASGNASLIASCGATRIEMLCEMGRYTQAVESAPAVIRLARRADPGGLAGALNNYAVALFSTGEAEAAIDAAREVLALPDATRAYAPYPLATIAIAAATLGWVAECRYAIEQFEGLVAKGLFDAETSREGHEIQDRIASAVAILEQGVPSRDGSTPSVR
jgi:DNA-binding SARP family transcriptional activator/energy-coupling factor transporter ATP-binding protein EcfA2